MTIFISESILSMQFSLHPILSFFEELYQQPIGQQRFKRYLATLQGNQKDELKTAIMGYNPMAKEHALLKVQELLEFGTETIALQLINAFNKEHQDESGIPFEVVINLADDLGGAWSNKAAADFESKFRFEGIFNHRFCTPYFWTSEELSTDLIQQRIQEYMYRTVFWQHNKGEKNLAYFVAQERFVHINTKLTNSNLDDLAFGLLKEFYENHQHTTNYSLIFNFFYGDEASEVLGYPTFGVSGTAGFGFVTR